LTKDFETLLHVLLVDDEAEMREAVRGLLERDGFRVSTARDGNEAIALLRAGMRVDLILLDLVMPEMDGWAFLDQKSLLPAPISEIPVIITSSDSSSDGAAKPDSDQWCAFVPKPFNTAALLKEVRRFSARTPLSGAHGFEPANYSL
jgi:CheY-like chemotaxis protein